jgi:putative transposase
LNKKGESAMKRGRFSEEQIIGILREAEAGQKVADVCRKYGVSQSTFQRWRSVHSGMEVSQVRRLRQLEEENRRLKHIVADLTLDNTMLKDIATKKW